MREDVVEYKEYRNHYLKTHLMSLRNLLNESSKKNLEGRLSEQEKSR